MSGVFEGSTEGETQWMGLEEDHRGGTDDSVGGEVWSNINNQIQI